MPSHILAERYELETVIGEGAMAVVYRATDLQLHRTVAVKLLRAQHVASDQSLERFQREARAAANLTHPNIVAVYDVGLEDDTPYIVMEYVEGANLKDLLRQESPLRPARVVELGTQLAAALEYAHQNGVVHRDIKPQNILVALGDTVKVTDFGIAAVSGESALTGAGMAVGTADYLSPEQARGEPARPASDVYSAGIVLYEMLTGHLPFRADNPVAVARMHAETPVPRPSMLNPSVPRGLEAVIMKALAKAPKGRYATAGDLERALLDYRSAGFQPTAATPVPPLVGMAAGTPNSGSRVAVVPLARRLPWAWLAVAGLALFALLAWGSIFASQPGSPGGSAAGPTPADVAGARATPGAAALPAETPTGTAEETPTETPTAAATETPTATATETPTVTATETPTATATESPTAMPTETPAPTPTEVPTAVPTEAPSPTPEAPPPPVAVEEPPPPTAVPPAATPEPPGPPPSEKPSQRSPEPPGPPPREKPSPPSPRAKPNRVASPSLGPALSVVNDRGYDVPDTDSYDDSERLRVLIGVARDSLDEYDQRAFFFLGDRLLGTDTLNPSAQVTFEGQEGDTIWIGYALYRPGDEMDDPTGGQAIVRYQWQDEQGRLVPLDPIPPEEFDAPLSRR